mgnify:CR=1 FL=1
MTDYTQITDFSAKDSLNTGDPEKIILGADYDAEFAAIATAIGTKVDTTDTATTSAAGIVELATSAEAITGTDTDRAVTPAALAAENTAARILAKLLTVDGAGSGLDADLLDGQSSAYYAPASTAALQATTIGVSGTGLSGGGSLAANRTITIDQTAMTTRNITGKAGVTKTLSTSAASGGSDGDIWYRY